MAAAMFDSRPIEIARPLLFESEEDAQRRAERRPALAQVAQKKRKAIWDQNDLSHADVAPRGDFDDFAGT
ncbi:hypothetical protein JL721_13163 [Aureococcus anophagefferens]|nr:hypothetical protein JL721_13163 [Aureococcus anophagefferens]